MLIFRQVPQPDRDNFGGPIVAGGGGQKTLIEANARDFLSEIISAC